MAAWRNGRQLTMPTVT